MVGAVVVVATGASGPVVVVGDPVVVVVVAAAPGTVEVEVPESASLHPAASKANPVSRPSSFVGRFTVPGWRVAERGTKRGAAGKTWRQDRA